MLSLPYLVFAIALVSVYGPSLYMSIVVIAFFSFASVGRIVRGQVLSITEKEYVEAARSLGASDMRILFVDILPNVLAPVIVYLTLLIPAPIVFEATLSFLGLGVVPPTASWGRMLATSISIYYQVAWWYVVFPGMALLTTTLAFNLLGDSVRDAFDPRYNRLFSQGDSHARFLVRRIFFGLLVMWVVATAIFLLYFVAAPDPPPRRQERRLAQVVARSPIGAQPPDHRPVLPLHGKAPSRRPGVFLREFRVGQHHRQAGLAVTASLVSAVPSCGSSWG